MTARRALTDAAGYAGIGAVGLGAALVFAAGSWRLAVDAYLLYLGAVVLLALTRVTRALVQEGDEPSELESFLRRRRKRRAPAEQLPSLARQEREVTLGIAGAFDLHQRLRPALVEVADHRLRDRYGISPAEQPERARELVGETAWELVRPDRPRPDNRHAPGIAEDDLREIVETLERL